MAVAEYQCKETWPREIPWLQVCSTFINVVACTWQIWQGFAMWHHTVNSLKEPVSTYTSNKKQAKMGRSIFCFVGALWLLIANFGFLESGVITGCVTSLPMHCEYPCNPTPPQPPLTRPLYGTPPPPAEPTYGIPPPLPTQPEYAAPPPPLTGYVYGAPPPPFTPPYGMPLPTTPQGNCQPPPMQVGNYPPYPYTYGYQPYGSASHLPMSSFLCVLEFMFPLILVF